MKHPAPTQHRQVLIKKIQKIPVTFVFHFRIRNEAQSCTVYTVANSIGRLRIISEYVTEVRVAGSAADFSATHTETPVFFFYYGRCFDRFRESWPAAAAFKFI